MNRSPRLEVDGLRLASASAGQVSGKPFSLALAGGECVTLLATQKADASSLLDMLAGHREAAAGRVRVDGDDITNKPPAQRAVGILSDRDPLFSHLSVRNNVAFPLAVRRLREPGRGHRVHATLALLGLETQADRHVGRLDPPAAVRAALARVLVCDPAVLLLDDALGLLDPVQRRDMQQLIRRLARARGFGLLLATGDREEALSMGDRIGILSGPALRQLGTAAELLDRPADESVAVGFGEANSLTGHVAWIEDDIAHVRLGAGPSMDAMASDGLAAGALCVLCVRPERIAVAFVSSGTETLGRDALAATLSDVVHLGDHLRMRFRLAGGGELLVRRPASQPMAGLHADRPALLAWPAMHATAFPLAP